LLSNAIISARFVSISSYSESDFYYISLTLYPINYYFALDKSTVYPSRRQFGLISVLSNPLLSPVGGPVRRMGDWSCICFSWFALSGDPKLWLSSWIVFMLVSRLSSFCMREISSSLS
jgi:hypothetical protein